MSRYAWLATALAFAVPAASAQDFVYQPSNPAFGGFPSNYSWLLSEAQLQNPYQEEENFRFFRDPLQEFESDLQRRVLDLFARELVEDRFGEFDLSTEGRFDLGDFTVEVVDGPNGLIVRLFNRLTGAESTITVPTPGGPLP